MRAKNKVNIYKTRYFYLPFCSVLLKKEVPYDAADDAEKYKNEDNYYNYHPCLHLSKFLLPLFLFSCRRRTPLARGVGMLCEMGTLKP